jgi:hypothetical protein
MKKTQLEWIKEQLLTTGEISRNYCLARYCSRLSARILDLEKEGWLFTTEKRNGDYVYKAINIPDVDVLYHKCKEIINQKTDLIDGKGPQGTPFTQLSLI